MTTDERLKDQLRALWQANLDAPASPARRTGPPPWVRAAAVTVVVLFAGALAYAQRPDTDETVTTDRAGTAPTTDPVEDTAALPPTFEAVIPVLDGSLPVTMVDGTELLVELDADGQYQEAKVSTNLVVERPGPLATPVYAGSAESLASADCARQRASSNGAEECASREHPVPRSNLSTWTSSSDDLSVTAVGFRQGEHDLAWLMPSAGAEDLSAVLEGTSASLAHDASLVFEGAVTWLDVDAVEYHVTLVDRSGSAGPAFSVSVGCATPPDDGDCVPSIVGVDAPGTDFSVRGPGRDLVGVIVIPEPSP